jgi:hypothetical protein
MCSGAEPEYVDLPTCNKPGTRGILSIVPRLFLDWCSIGALLLQQHPRHGGELLGHRCDMKDCLRSERNVVFEIGLADCSLVIVLCRGGADAV